jgi:hypothetical protein
MLHVDATGSFLNVAGTFPHSTCDATYRLPGGGGSAPVPFCGRPYIDMAPEGQRWANVVVEERRIVGFHLGAKLPLAKDILPVPTMHEPPAMRLVLHSPGRTVMDDPPMYRTLYNHL